MVWLSRRNTAKRFAIADLNRPDLQGLEIGGPMIARGMGLISSSNFYVPQVNLPGSMAAFIRPAGARVPVMIVGGAGLGRIVRRGRRGLGQDQNVDDTTGIPYDTTISVPPADISMPVGGQPPSSDPYGTPPPGMVYDPGTGLLVSVPPTPPGLTTTTIPPKQQQPFNWAPLMQKGTYVQSPQGLIYSSNTPPGASLLNIPGLTTASASSLMPILLIGGGLLLVMMMAKK